ncbi:unnamed protein product [Effrenium voratum]|nr:unnamed protein product [Effrenium voratum]
MGDPVADELQALTTIGQIFDHLSIQGEANNRFTVQVAADGTRTEVGRAPTVRELGAARYAARLCRLRLGTEVATVAGTASAASPAPVTGGDNRKVRLSQVLSQVDDTEIDVLSESTLLQMYARYETVFGRDCRPPIDRDPTAEQVSGIHSLVSTGRTPHCDFAVFGPHGARIMKRIKFHGLVQDKPGQLTRAELYGPPDFSSWKACFDTYCNALILLGTASLGPLTAYRTRIEKLHTRYGNRVWALLYQADVRCRLEHMPRTKMRLLQRHQDAIAAGGVSAFSPASPWSDVFTEVAADDRYWNDEVVEPALMVLTDSGSLRDLVSGDARTGRQGVDDASRGILAAAGHRAKVTRAAGAGDRATEAEQQGQRYGSQRGSQRVRRRLGRAPTNPTAEPHVGGLRRTFESVEAVPGLVNLGVQIRNFLDSCLDKNPELEDRLLASLGKPKGAFLTPAAWLDDVRCGLVSILLRAVGESACPEKIKSLTGPVSNRHCQTDLRAGIFDLWARAAQDPGAKIVPWLTDGAPGGILLHPELDGLFPKVTEEEEFERLDPEGLWTDLDQFANYEGIESNEAARETIQGYADAGFLKVCDSLDECRKHLGAEPVVSKLGCITKVKTLQGGSRVTKHRIILDEKRSLVTASTSRRYKSVLPRATDVVWDALELQSDALPGEITTLLVADVENAFWLLPLAPSERRFFVAKLRGKYFVFLRTAQGSRSAPLTFAAVMALSARLVQSVLLRDRLSRRHPQEGRLEVYVDDPIAVLSGTPSKVRRLASLVLVPQDKIEDLMNICADSQVSERAAEQRAASLRAKSVTEAAAEEKAAECIMEKSRSDPFDEVKALEVAMEGGYDWTSVGRPVCSGLGNDFSHQIIEGPGGSE